MTLAFGLEFPGCIAIEPTDNVSAKSATAVQVTADGFGLAPLVDFHTPLCAPPIYTVFPEGSPGSMATAVARPETRL
jgi:hypothetical protein